jgi:PAS domain S-box-containing protein
LQAKDLPNYFSYLANHRVTAVNDVFDHIATSEFNVDYTQANDIGAMLDGSILLNNQVIGVICHEHLGGPREWALDEQSFAGSVADLVRLTVESHKRKQVEGDLLYQQKNLESIVETRVAAIENNAKLFRFLVDRAPVIILYMNDANEVIEMNPEAERVSGYSREFAIGKTYEMLFSSAETKQYNQSFVQKLSSGETKLQGEDLLVRCADGSHVELSVSRSMELDADGNPVIISIGQDVSKQKALAASLIKAREAAESADRIKSMFVASMSHELRTPLNSIIGFLGVVLQGMSGELNVKQKDQLGRAYHSAKHLLSLISDVIDISKIEAGFLQVHEEKVHLNQLLDEVFHAVAHLAEEKRLLLTMDCVDKLQLETDRKRLYQVVLNVVSNALKYTERGSVIVTTVINKNWLIVAVEDTGIGIAKVDLDNLFKPFERIESKLKVKTLGTGLGLYLTRKILSQLLGGTIEVKSTLGEGSTFTIKVPLKLPKVIKQANSSILEKY